MRTRWLLVGVMLLLTSLLLGSCGIPQEEYDALLSERDSSQAQAASLSGELEDVQKDLGVLQSRFAKAEGDLATLSSKLEAVKGDLSATKSSLSAARNNLAEAELKLAKPTVPVLLSPQSLQVFQQFPRTTTLKWLESNGAVPILYLVEVEYTWGTSSKFVQWNDGDHDNTRRAQTEDTEFIFDFVGAQPGRWRVKATNSLGDSNWSEWRYLRYTK